MSPIRPVRGQRWPAAAWVLGLAACVVSWSPTASAGFDLVSLYQSKVKQFESVYFLEGDKGGWKRDRRVFELFSELDMIRGQDEKNHVNTAFGSLFNFRPHKKSQVQLGFFNLFSGNQLFDTTSNSSNWEALHGARLAAGDWLELSIGGYWRKPNGVGDAAQLKTSAFFELNSPSIFVRSSSVLGIKEENPLARWDLRLDYDQSEYMDSAKIGVIRYDYAITKWMFGLDVKRLGHPSFRFFTFESRFSKEGFAWIRTGLDWTYQSDEDYNLRRRGHFGTSMSLKAMYTHVDTQVADIFGRDFEGRRLHGGYGELTLQIPAKWFWTFIMVVAASQSEDEEVKEFAGDMLADTLNEPRDITFVRLSLVYTYNEPDTFSLPVPAIENSHRAFLAFGLLY